MTYTLNQKETGNKAAKFHYTITDENGNVVSERKSNREYVAATINGQFYFSRIDLIGKGEHGNQIKMNRGFDRVFNPKSRKWDWIFDEKIEQRENLPIAYKK